MSPRFYGVSSLKGVEEEHEITVQLLGHNVSTYSYNDLKALNFKVILSTLSFPINEIKVSATRWSQSLNNIPTKISSVPIENRSNLHTQTTADLLGSTGEVFIQKSQQGGGSPMIREFSANRVLYIVDGVRMNTAVFRGENVHNIISLDPFLLQYIEVLFGPNSALYGSDDIGGVMRYFTRKSSPYTKGIPKVAFQDLTCYSTPNKEKTILGDIEWRSKKIASLTSFSFTGYWVEYLQNSYKLLRLHFYLMLLIPFLFPVASNSPNGNVYIYYYTIECNHRYNDLIVQRI